MEGPLEELGQTVLHLAVSFCWASPSSWFFCMFCFFILLPAAHVPTAVSLQALSPHNYMRLSCCLYNFFLSSIFIIF